MINHRLPSERISVAAPMSFAGSLQRSRNILDHGAAWIPVVILLVMLWWTAILCWYLMFGLLLVPFRILRRGSRKRRREEARHREMLEAVARTREIR
jgi:hypothetical protein